MSEQEAYAVLGVSEHCSKKGVKKAYLELVKTELRCEQPCEEKLVQYQEAYDVLLDRCLVRQQWQMTHELWRVIQMLLGGGIILILFLMVSQLDQYKSNESKETVASWIVNKDESLTSLSHDFDLTIGTFQLIKESGWAYQDLGETWLVVVPVKVRASHTLGALLSNKQFSLDGVGAVNMNFEAISCYPLLQADYFLGPYYELVPEDEQFIVSFYTTPFEVNESRTLIFEHPNETHVELALLNYQGELPFANEQNFVEN